MGVVRQRPQRGAEQPGGEDDTAEHDVEEVLGLRQVKDADVPEAVALRVAQDVAERAERQVAGTEDDAEDHAP